MSSKICTVCKTQKPLDNFYNSKISKDGKGYRCKTCDAAARKVSRDRSRGTQRGIHRRRLMKIYGITVETFQAMLEEQHHRCAICRTDNPLGEGNSTNRAYFSFSVDHCHETGVVRGLLCNTCNRGLGFFKDNPDLLIAAVNYLRGH